MKRIFLVIMSIVAAFCLSACGSKLDTNDILDRGSERFAMNMSGSPITAIETDAAGNAILAENNGKVISLASDGNILYNGNPTEAIQDWPEGANEVSILANPAGFAFYFKSSENQRFVDRNTDIMEMQDCVILYDKNLKPVRKFANAIACNRGELFGIDDDKQYAQIRIVYLDEQQNICEYAYSVMPSGQTHIDESNTIGRYDEICVADQRLIARSGQSVSYFEDDVQAANNTINIRYVDTTIRDFVYDMRINNWSADGLDYHFYA